VEIVLHASKVKFIRPSQYNGLPVDSKVQETGTFIEFVDEDHKFVKILTSDNKIILVNKKLVTEI